MDHGRKRASPLAAARAASRRSRGPRCPFPLRATHGSMWPSPPPPAPRPRRHHAIFGSLLPLLTLHQQLEISISTSISREQLETTLAMAPAAAPKAVAAATAAAVAAAAAEAEVAVAAVVAVGVEAGVVAGGCDALGRGVALCRCFLAVMPRFERCHAHCSRAIHHRVCRYAAVTLPLQVVQCYPSAMRLLCNLPIDLVLRRRLSSVRPLAVGRWWRASSLVARGQPGLLGPVRMALGCSPALRQL